MPHNEVDSFLNEVNGTNNDESFYKNDSDPFAQGEQAPKTEDADGSEEGDNGDDDLKDDKRIPFHQDPKVLKFIEKEVKKRIKEASPSVTPSATAAANNGPEGSDELTAILTQIIGNDTPEKAAAVKAFHKQLIGLEERGAQRAMRQLEEQAQVQAQQEEEAYEYLQSAFDGIEEQFNVDFSTAQGRKTRNDFVDFIARIAPKDENGVIEAYPDINEAWNLFSANRKPVENTRAKNIAARSMARSSEASAAPQRGNNWKDVDRLFSKLQK